MSIANEENTQANKDGKTRSRLFFLLLLTGFVLVAVGAAIVFVAIMLTGSGLVSGGAVIFIGPVPIVIGAGPEAAWLVLFSIILTILSIMIFFVMRRKMRLFGD